MNWREKGVERESEGKWKVEMDGSDRILEEDGLCVEEMLVWFKRRYLKFSSYFLIRKIGRAHV